MIESHRDRREFKKVAVNRPKVKLTLYMRTWTSNECTDICNIIFVQLYSNILGRVAHEVLNLCENSLDRRH